MDLDRLARRLKAYGAFVGRNQIKVLLLNCALLFTVVLAIDPFDLLPWTRRLPTWWTADSTIVASDNPICLKAVPNEAEVRLLQLKVNVDSGHEHGVLDRGLLHITSQAQKLLNAQLNAHTQPGTTFHCLRPRSDAENCLLSSPLAYWNGSETLLLSDRHLLETLSANVSNPVLVSKDVHVPMNAVFGGLEAGTGFAVQSAKEQIISWFMVQAEQPRSIGRKNAAREEWLPSWTASLANLGSIKAAQTKTKHLVLKVCRASFCDPKV